MKVIITFTDDKKEKLKCLSILQLRIQRPSVRFLIAAIGKIISCMLASKVGLLSYLALENDKTEPLKMNKVGFDATAILNVEAKLELK